MDTIDLSALPPAAIWALVIVYLVCKVLPDHLVLAPKQPGVK